MGTAVLGTVDPAGLGARVGVAGRVWDGLAGGVDVEDWLRGVPLGCCGFDIFCSL